MYQKTIEDLDTEERSAKKRKRDDTNGDNTDQQLQKQVEELTERLTKQDNELHEVREQLAENEFAEPGQTVIDTAYLIKTFESALDKRMNEIDARFSTIEESIKHKETSDNGKNVTSYANVLTKNIDEKLLGNVLTAVKNTEKDNDTERHKREKNIIIYGAKLDD